MNPRIVAAFCTLLALPAAATAQEQKDLIAKRDQKLASRFLAKTKWFTTLKDAKAAAVRSGKPILIYFTRSYAPSSACDAVENEVLATDEFVALARRAELLCHITSKVKGAADPGLLAKMGGESLPYLIATDEAARPLVSLGRVSSIGDIAGLFKQVDEYFELRARALAGDKKAKATWFLARLQRGHLSPEEIEAELEKADYLSPAQTVAIRKRLASLEVFEILESMDEKDPKSRTAVAKRLVAMMRAGRVPDDRYAFPFWQFLLAHADQNVDVDLFETALRRIRKLPGVKLERKWLLRMEKKLEAMKFIRDRDKRRKKDQKRGNGK